MDMEEMVYKTLDEAYSKVVSELAHELLKIGVDDRRAFGMLAALEVVTEIRENTQAHGRKLGLRI